MDGFIVMPPAAVIKSSIVPRVMLVSLFVASVMLPALSMALMLTVCVVPWVRPVNVLLSCQSPLSNLY